jgi:hypothetical protein
LEQQFDLIYDDGFIPEAPAEYVLVENRFSIEQLKVMKFFQRMIESRIYGSNSNDTVTIPTGNACGKLRAL